MNRIKKFVSNLLRDYFNEQDKRELIEILTTSLQEKVADLVEAGTPVETAIDRSIREFGSADDVLRAFPDRSAEFRTTLAKRRKSGFLFSLFGYAAVVGLVLFINLRFREFFNGMLPTGIVAIAALFWPAAMFYVYRIAKK